MILHLWTRLVLHQPATRKKPRFADITDTPADARQVQAAMLLASFKDCHGVVILRDCEKAGNLGLGDVLRQGRAESNETIPTAIGTASRCHETWLLADRNAVQEILDDEAIFHFNKPEERPHCDDLKDHIRTHSERLHLDPYQVRSQLAFRGSPQELRKRCKKCYAAFEKDVDQEIRPLLRTESESAGESV